MPDEIEYLVKYSVAPAPSRDYYGIRILPNEVDIIKTIKILLSPIL